MSAEDETFDPRGGGGGTRWLVIFILGVVLVFNLSAWYLYRLTREELDSALGDRLQSIASVVAGFLSVNPALQVDDPGLRSSLLDVLEEDLAEIREQNDLSNLFVVGSADTTWIDLSGVVERGEPNPFLALDFSAVALARSGIASYSRLYEVGGQFMKSGYAPLTGSDGAIRGIVGVEAGAAFFSSLRKVRGVLLGVSLGSGLGIVALGFMFFAVSRNLTRARIALERAETLTAMGRMAANLAHEIRNPLAIIKGSAERLSGTGPTDEERIELCRFIADEVDRLNRTLTGYLSFARGDAILREEFDVLDLLRRTLKYVEPELAKQGIATETRFEEERRPMIGDPNRLQQVFFNLLLNAQEALPDGGRISIEERISKSGFQLVFGDDGHGIEKEDLRKIFEPFFTRKSRGSGLGLAVVRRIVTAHGGKVEVRSSPGAGTTLTLRFPASRPVKSAGRGEA